MLRKNWTTSRTMSRPPKPIPPIPRRCRSANHSRAAFAGRDLMLAGRDGPGARVPSAELHGRFPTEWLTERRLAAPPSAARLTRAA